MGFCRATFLAEGRICKTGKQKTAKTSVTAEVWHDTQVRKSDPEFRKFTFFKLVGIRGGKPATKSSLTRIILSSSLWIVNITPLFINPRILKRYLISKNLV